MKISIALCTFNGEIFLKDQFLSIFHQTRLPDELIICDDHSTDKTIEIIDSFKASSPFPVRVIQNSSNIGSTKNFEKAVRLCTGDIIAFADQDDVWKPQKLEIISKAFLADPKIGYVFSNAELVDAELKPLGVNLWESVGFTKREYQNYLEGKQFEVLLKRNVVTGTTMAFRAFLKELVLPFSENWIHDEWIATLASIVGIKGLPIPELLVLYRQHSSQQLGEHKEKIWEMVDKSLKISADDFGKLASICQEVKERIFARQAVLDEVQCRRIEILEKKINHFLNRKLIHSTSGLLKLKTIFTEARLKNYKYFSCGWLSIGRDIFSKPKF
jgi:glycosyltransferase involved in cell wall biosynthesis